MKKVIVILGQTATGKSNLAVKIAKKINGEIISADSRQVYKYLEIGTGKITEKEMQGISHHMLSVANPKKTFTVRKYQKATNSAIAEILAKEKIPIICGGTGFYIDAITKGLIFPNVKPNKKLRNNLLQKDAIALFCELQKLDPNRTKNIKKNNEQNNKARLIRAIEIAKALGKVPKITQALPLYKFIKIGLYLEPKELKKKIEKRVNKIFKDGLLKEIENLKKIGIKEKRLKEFGFEYNNPTEENVIKETLKYAKRQKTYFKRDKEIKWFNPRDIKKIEKYIKENLS